MNGPSLARRLLAADARFGAKVAGTAWAERVRLLGA